MAENRKPKVRFGEVEINPPAAVPKGQAAPPSPMSPTSPKRGVEPSSPKRSSKVIQRVDDSETRAPLEFLEIPAIPKKPTAQARSPGAHDSLLTAEGGSPVRTPIVDLQKQEELKWEGVRKDAAEAKKICPMSAQEEMAQFWRKRASETDLGATKKAPEPEPPQPEQEDDLQRALRCVLLPLLRTSLFRLSKLVKSKADLGPSELTGEEEEDLRAAIEMSKKEGGEDPEVERILEMTRGAGGAEGAQGTGQDNEDEELRRAIEASLAQGGEDESVLRALEESRRGVVEEEDDDEELRRALELSKIEV